MNYPFCETILEKKIVNNVYSTYELNYPKHKEEFLEYILPVLKDEYGVGIEFEEKIKNIKSERTDNLKKFMKKYMIPNPDKNRCETRPWLKNTRSKISEAIAKDILKNIDNVTFTCRVSKEEEDPDMPKRGIDNFGFIFKEDNDNVELCSIVACEVKASDSKDSPPAVVHVTNDSLYNSLLEMCSIDERLKKAIAKSIDKLSDSQYFELLCNIAADIESGENFEKLKNKITIVPFLFRKKEFYTEKDFGKFESNYKDFESSTIKYYIITIDYELNDFADEVYTKLREG
ncbi:MULTISPECIES: hypothetical protein [unclassified Clostridium]|uniref:hypothetical protein n=1 Tax=unclassified Clostridium TaxID=2614128 RepID=UPI0020799320|nr:MULTISPECIES: hypothetical protein [unclassified Clostridium]